MINSVYDLPGICHTDIYFSTCCKPITAQPIATVLHVAYRAYRNHFECL